MVVDEPYYSWFTVNLIILFLISFMINISVDPHCEFEQYETTTQTNTRIFVENGEIVTEVLGSTDFKDRIALQKQVALTLTVWLYFIALPLANLYYFILWFRFYRKI